jgi:hypothetical protein
LNVFGLFGLDEDKLAAALEGTLCLGLHISDFRGRTATWEKPIAVMHISNR